MEEWRSISGFEGILQVSSYGTFRRLASKPSQGNSGKERIIKVNSGLIRLRVLGESYRLVATRTIFSTFNPDIDITNKRITYSDRDSSNLRLDNLVAITMSELHKRTLSEHPEMGFNDESHAKSQITKAIYGINDAVWEHRRERGTTNAGCTSEQAMKGVETKRRLGIPLGGFTSESALKGWETKRLNKLKGVM